MTHYIEKRAVESPVVLTPAINHVIASGFQSKWEPPSAKEWLGELVGQMDDQGTSDALPPCEDEHAPDDLMTDDKDEAAGPQTTLKPVAEVKEGTEATEGPHLTDGVGVSLKKEGTQQGEPRLPTDYHEVMAALAREYDVMSETRFDVGRARTNPVDLAMTGPPLQSVSRRRPSEEPRQPEDM